MTPSFWLVAVAVVAAVNPARLSPALPRADRDRAGRVGVAALGAASASGVLVALAAAGPAIVDWLSVSDPTMRIGAGLVVAVAALRQAVTAPPAAEPALSGWGAAVVPVAVPLVLRPEVGLLAISGGTDGRTGAVLAGLAVCVIGVSAAALTGDDEEPTVVDRVVAWLARLGEAVALVAGIAVAVSGVLDV